MRSGFRVKREAFKEWGIHIYVQPALIDHPVIKQADILMQVLRNPFKGPWQVVLPRIATPFAGSQAVGKRHTVEAGLPERPQGPLKMIIRGDQYGVLKPAALTNPTNLFRIFA
jgi:hypothetical protein